jgi:hypothetical protein
MCVILYLLLVNGCHLVCNSRPAVSESVHTSLIVLLDPENVRVAVGISLPQAQIQYILYELKVNFSHVW